MMSTLMDSEEIPGSNVFNYEETLAIEVYTAKETENATLKCYFGFLTRSGVVIDTSHKYCNECLKQKKIVRYSLRTSTGNLSGHLETRHRIKLSSKKVNANQRKVSDMLFNQKSTISSVPQNDKRYLLARQLCLWFCRDLIPFNNSNKPGLTDFFRWAKIIGFEESLPDRSTLAGAALNDIYDVVYGKVKTFLQLSLPNVLGVSFDFWSDNVRRLSYISYWINWINDSFQMQNVCLKTSYFPHPHTGVKIAEDFEKVKEEFGLTSKIFRACTDNGKNIKAACRILRLDWDSCLAHNISLLVSTDLLKHKDMEELKLLQKKMKKINKALVFKYEELRKIHDEEYNTTLYRIFTELENISQLLETSEFLISDFDIEDEDVEMVTRFCTDQVRSSTQFTTNKNSNETRWNSVLTMFNSFDKNIDVINNCLERIKNYDLILSDTEHKTIKEFIKILSVFEKATDVFQGSKYPTLNMTMIFYVEIKDNLRSLQKDRSLSGLAQRAISILLDRFDDRFRVNDEMVVTSFLDPSMQHLPIIKDYLETHEIDVVELLHAKWVKYELTAEVGSSHLNKESVKKTSIPPGAKRIRLELIEKHCAVGAVVGHSPLECIRREVNKYTSIIGVLEEPLTWWIKNRAQFLYLSKLAKTMLSFMATSAIVERFFSKAGILVTKRKANLNPTTMQKILFIHENYELIKDFYR